ncbi:MAG: ArnT family glycosyltransferase [Thermoplasmatota archaeon]
MKRLSAFEAACVTLILAAIAARAAAAASAHIVIEDAAEFTEMARSFAQGHEFFERWSGYSHYYPPAFPVIAGVAFLAAGGASLAALKAASVATGIAAILVVFATTRDLFGREKAFASAALFATFPMFIEYEAHGFSESLVTLFFVLTIWGILRSLDKPHYIVLAGVFAGLGYLTKSSMGYFFLLAGAMGFAWRFYYMRWRVLREKWYAVAAALFAVPVFVWGGRNVARFGWPNWETQPHAGASLAALATNPGAPAVLLGKTLFFLLILFAFAAPWLRPLARSLRKIRDERVSGLWMAVGTPVIVAIFFVTAFYFAEHRPFIDPDNKRYLVTCVPILAWIALRDADERDTTSLAVGLPRKRALMLGLAALAAGLAAALAPTAFALSSSRVGAQFFLDALAVLLALVSLLFVWKREEKKRGKETDVRFVRASVPSGAILGAFGFLALGFAIGYAVALVLVPFFLAAAVAACAIDWRAKVLCVATVLLGASLAGAAPYIPIEKIDADLPCGSVGTSLDDALFVWPFLKTCDAPVVLGRNSSAPDRIVVLLPASEPHVTGYVTERVYEGAWETFPGTTAELWLEDHVFGGAPHPPASNAAYVLVRQP